MDLSIQEQKSSCLREREGRSSLRSSFKASFEGIKLPHILAYVHAYLPSHMAGAETTLHDILKLLMRHGWTATVMLDSATGTNYSYEGVNVVHFDPNDRCAFNREAFNCDVIITHLECSERAVYVAREASVPVVQLVHNTMWQTEGYLGLGCDLAIYNTEWVADHHAEALKSPMIRVLSMVDDDLIKVDYRVREGRTDFNSVILHPMINPLDYRINDGPHDHIGFVNFFKGKGPHIFYEMARRFPDEKFLGLKGGYGEQLIEDGFANVTLLENTPNIRDEFYSRIKVLLMPSKYESFGRVAIEAASSGIPTVASPTPGLLEALGHRGVYATYNDMDMWERRLGEVLRMPPQYHKTLAINTSCHWYRESAFEANRLVSAMNRLTRVTV